MSTNAQPATRPTPMTRRTELLALGGIVAVAALLYCWRLGLQGWANEYYAAAVQSAARDWSSALWAGVEWGGHEALDKPPLFVWPMALSARLFGLSTASMLAPQILLTLATVVVLERAVSRTHGAAAGLAAAALFALTPVVVVLARFNDPDVAVTFLSVVAAYGTVRYVQGGSGRWLAAAGALIGLAFLCKWMAGFLALPALVVAVLVARRPGRWRALAVAAGSCAVAGLWWVALYALWPGSHPTPDGGSSLADLLLGRNGFSRIVTADVTTRNGINGEPGLGRLVRWPMDGQLGWFVPAALVACVLVWRERVRDAGTALWVTWFVTTALVLSFMGGPMHPYYLHVVAPGLAATLAVGGLLLARAPDRAPLAALAVVLVAAQALAVFDAHHPLPTWWQHLVEGAALLAVVALLVPRLRHLAVVPALVAALTGPVAFDLLTVNHPVLGANPTAGPELRRDTPPLPAEVVDLVRAAPGRYGAAVPMAAHAAMLQLQSDRPVLPLGGYTGRAGSPTLDTVHRLVREGELRLVVLTGPYATSERPKDLLGRPADAIVEWARATGCARRVGTVTVIDLSRRC